MSVPMQLFLQWEIILQCDLLLQPLNAFATQTDPTLNISLYNFFIQYQLPVTIDQMRAAMTLPPHPDTVAGLTPSRGSSFVYADNVVNSSDATVPDVVLVSTWNGLVAKNNDSPEPVTEGQLKTIYAVLYSDASAAAGRLGVTLS